MHEYISKHTHIRTFKHTHIRTLFAYLCTLSKRWAWRATYMYVFTCISTHAYIHYSNMYVYVCVCVHRHTHTRTHTRARIRQHTRTHTYTYKHTHTHTPELGSENTYIHTNTNTHTHIHQSSDPTSLMIFGIYFTVVNPLAEEFFWRGFLGLAYGISEEWVHRDSFIHVYILHTHTQERTSWGVFLARVLGPCIWDLGRVSASRFVYTCIHITHTHIRMH
jgi:hypothetical protein